MVGIEKRRRKGRWGWDGMGWDIYAHDRKEAALVPFDDHRPRGCFFWAGFLVWWVSVCVCVQYQFHPKQSAMSANDHPEIIKQHWVSTVSDPSLTVELELVCTTRIASLPKTHPEDPNPTWRLNASTPLDADIDRRQRLLTYLTQAHRHLLTYLPHPTYLISHTPSTVLYFLP